MGKKSSPKAPKLRLFLSILFVALLLFAVTAGIWLWLANAKSTTLDCLTPEVRPVLLALEGSRVLICETGTDKKGEAITKLQIVDTAQDAAIHTTRKGGHLTPIPSSKAEDRLYFTDGGQTLISMNRKLKDITTITVASGKGAVTAGAYYYAQEGFLFRLDLSTGDIQPMAINRDIAIAAVTGIHPEGTRLTVEVYLDAYQNDTGCGVVSIPSGELLMLTDAYHTVNLFEDRYLAHEVQTSAVYTGKLGSDDRLHLPSTLASRISVDGAPFLLDSSTEKVETTLFHIDKAITQCALAQQGIPGNAVAAAYMAENHALLLCMRQEEGYSLVVVPIGKLPFTAAEAGPLPAEAVSRELLDNYANSQIILAPNYRVQESRQYADQLQQRYGITLLISDQCALSLEHTPHRIATTDKIGLYAKENRTIMAALKAVEETLERYPEVFFRQFQLQEGRGGIRILLTGTVESDYSNIGFSYQHREWFNIVIDITTTDDIRKTLCHELWHATEQRIGLTDNDAFTDGRWEECNPIGFAYSNNTSDYHNDIAYTYGSDKAVCFIDPYAKVSAAEDRARLMEAAMVPESYPTADIFNQPILQKKLQLLCAAIRDAFDTTGWQEVYWEQYLTN